MCITVKHMVMLPCLGYVLVTQKRALNIFNLSTSAGKGFQKISNDQVVSLGLFLLQGLFSFFTELMQSNRFSIRSRLTKRVAQHLQRWDTFFMPL